MNYKISVIIPVYKVEKELLRCVESIMGQTYRNLEIILVDDGSPDRCPQMCEEYARQDSRISVIHKENGGLSDARNTGLKAAAGDYILYVDSDDYIDKDTCERLAAAIPENGVDIVVGEARRIIEGRTELMMHSGLEEHKVYSGREFVKKAIQVRQWYAPAVLNLYRREFLLQNRLMFEKGILHEDMEMLPRVFLASPSPSVVYMSGPFYNYLIREGSITQSKDTTRNAMCMFDIFRKWKYLFDREQDPELRKLLYGFLMKCYLYTCRECRQYEKNPPYYCLKYVLKYSLDAKELLKGIVFRFFPCLYINL